MNKKIFKILSFVFICIAVVFVIYKVDSANRTKERMVDETKNLMDSISAKDYDKIRMYVKKADGTELSDQEISNFLLNTGLYRAMIINYKEPSFTYSTNVNFFNTNKGKIAFSYKALNSDLIVNELEYHYTYFITNDIEKSDKEIKRYPFAKDLANGKEINYKKDNSEIEVDKLLVYKYIQDENGNLYIEINEEAKDDLRIAMFNMLDENLGDKENEYRHEWNEDCSIVSVYYNGVKEPSYFNKLYVSTIAVLGSVTIQALNENPNWHLTINYYDYDTKELLYTEIIR